MKIEAARRLLVANEDGILKFVNNNPGGDWLENKRRYIESRPRDSHGVPVMGSETGYFNRPALMPVEVVLRKIKGKMSEQLNVRQDSLKWIMQHMRETKRLPQSSSGGDYLPYITVDYTGKPWVNEGNHRIMSAYRLGIKVLPVHIMYFDGGELENDIDGRPPYALHPDLVLACDKEAHRWGYTFDNYATHRKGDERDY